jgi:hypothetical protein
MVQKTDCIRIFMETGKARDQCYSISDESEFKMCGLWNSCFKKALQAMQGLETASLCYLLLHMLHLFPEYYPQPSCNSLVDRYFL